MIYTIVPVKNEGEKIKKTLQMLLSTKTNKILVVLNGCDDHSFQIVKSFNHRAIEFIYFNKALGIDVPRAVGAWIALLEGAEGVVFVDGDMNGNIHTYIDEIIKSLVEKNVDMALTNCYPEEYQRGAMAKMLLSFQKQLNIELKICNKIGYASPSHGPHGLSRRCIQKIDTTSLCIPPISLALAVKNNLNIEVATSIPSPLLNSTIRDEFHADQIAKTIIGDCIEALHVYKQKERTRGYDGVLFTGYHKNRRFDLLEVFMKLDWFSL